MQITFFLHLFS